MRNRSYYGREKLHYADLMAAAGLGLRLVQFTQGRPYHAMLVVVSPRAASGQPHEHADFCELIYVTAGHGRHRLPAGSQDLNPGDLVLIRPTDRHQILPTSPARLQFLNIAFSSASWQDFLSLTGADTSLWAATALPPVVSLVGNDARRCEAAFRQALDRYHHNPTGVDLIRLWVEAVELLPANDDSAGTFRPAWLVWACSGMHEEENLRLGLPRLVELASVSPGHLSRCMRRYYGTTPVGLVTDLRIRRAAALLTSTTATISEIAVRCGFGTNSYLDRCFRRAYGMSPREFRDQARRAIVP